MKLSVIYHSESGNTQKMAEAVVEGMNKVEGAEAKCFSIDEADEDWIKESSCIVVGTPVYYAEMSGKVKLFLEKCGKYGLAGKLGGAFATANFVHGGGEIAIQAIQTHMLVYGMMVYSGGGSFGQPVIHLGPVGVRGQFEELAENFRIYGERMAKKTKELGI
ncbi:MAG: NAD(P)H-dependent oxidoreductase [Lachnospiraceae bacterium]|nr:NAD(P)H-dependent oxidoreductase [Lachnospiraceae bacterium]